MKPLTIIIIFLLLATTALGTAGDPTAFLNSTRNATAWVGGDNGIVNATGNMSTPRYVLSTLGFVGPLSWGYLYGYPSACGYGSAYSTLADSPTCTNFTALLGGNSSLTIADVTSVSPNVTAGTGISLSGQAVSINTTWSDARYENQTASDFTTAFDARYENQTYSDFLTEYDSRYENQTSSDFTTDFDARYENQTESDFTTSFDSRYENQTWSDFSTNVATYAPNMTESDTYLNITSGQILSFLATTYAAYLDNRYADLANFTDAGNAYQDDIGSDCSAGNFVKGVDDDGTLDCDAPAGSGDVTSVRTNATNFLTGGAESGDISLDVNLTSFDARYENGSGSSYTNASFDTSAIPNGAGYFNSIVNFTTDTDARYPNQTWADFNANVAAYAPNATEDSPFLSFAAQVLSFSASLLNTTIKAVGDLRYSGNSSITAANVADLAPNVTESDTYLSLSGQVLSFLASDFITFIDGRYAGNSSLTAANVASLAPNVTESDAGLSLSGQALSLVVLKDLVAGDGLNGGADNVLTGADADVTLTFDCSEVAGDGLTCDGEDLVFECSDVAGDGINCFDSNIELSYDMNQDVETTDAVTFATVDTGYGANELWDMNQHVLTTSDVTFDNTTVNSLALGDNEPICLGDSGCSDGKIYWNGTALIFEVTS